MNAGRIPHKKTRLYGIEFDSKAEARRYLELRQKLKDGDICNLVLQPQFDLIPTQKVKGQKTLRSHKYTADFQYIQHGRLVVEDVKSEHTRHDREYILNRKLMYMLKGIYVHEVIR